MELEIKSGGVKGYVNPCPTCALRVYRCNMAMNKAGAEGLRFRIWGLKKFDGGVKVFQRSVSHFMLIVGISVNRPLVPKRMAK